MSFTISAEHNAVRLQATFDFANLGSANSVIEFYTTLVPDSGSAPAVTVVLAKPCGAITPDGLVLAQASPGGDMALASGTLLSARWLNGNGVIVGEGDVSDTDGDGAFKLSGAMATLVYAGGSVLLGTVAVT